ncbi:hypothetical protein Tco_0552174 [Tanacetum coccineum]
MPSLALTIHSYLPPLPPRLMNSVIIVTLWLYWNLGIIVDLIVNSIEAFGIHGGCWTYSCMENVTDLMGCLANCIDKRKGLCMISTETGNELQHNEAQSESNGHSTNETNDANLSQMRNQNELGGLCSCRKIPDVVQYLSDAVSRKIVPTAITWNILVRAVLHSRPLGRHFVKLQLGLAFFFMQIWCKKGVYDDLQLALSVVVITLSKVSFSLHYSSKACIWLSIFPHYLSKNRIEENPSQRWSKEFLRSARCLVAFILNLNFYDFFVGLQMLGVSRGQEFSQCLLPLMKIQ